MRDTDLEVVEVPTSDLIPYANNANVHTAHQIDQIVASIEEFGFIDPVGVWENAEGGVEIVEGHGRVLAAKRLGMGAVPVIYLNALTDEQRRAYTHVHNQLTRNSTFDDSILESEIEALPFDWDALGFEVAKDAKAADVVEDDPPIVAIEAKAKAGDVWQLGEHRLVCGDSTNPRTLEAVMGEEKADLLLTDPPYNVALGHHMRPSEAKQLHRRTDGLVIDNDAFDDEREFEDFLVEAFDAATPFVRAGGGSMYGTHRR